MTHQPSTYRSGYNNTTTHCINGNNFINKHLSWNHTHAHPYLTKKKQLSLNKLAQNYQQPRSVNDVWTRLYSSSCALPRWGSYSAPSAETPSKFSHFTPLDAPTSFNKYFQNIACTRARQNIFHRIKFT